MLQWDRSCSQENSIALLCIPLAGGGPSIFRRWQRSVPAWLRIVPAELRGRERRLHQETFVEIRQTAIDLLPQLDAIDASRVALFGYSMGAFVAYELARMLTARSRPPLHLIVSASRAPHEAPCDPLMYRMSGAALRARLGELGAASELLTEELFELVEPTLRADLQAAETYRHIPSGELECPITALCGESDPLAPPSAVRPWKDYTRGRFSMRIFPAGHYFAQEREDEVVAEVADNLRA